MVKAKITVKDVIQAGAFYKTKSNKKVCDS